MKIKFFLIGIIFLHFKYANAQSDNGRIGFNLGFAASQAKLKFADGTSNNSDVDFGFIVGIYKSFRINDFLSFQPEINYISKSFPYIKENDSTFIQTGVNSIEYPYYTTFKVNTAFSEIEIPLKLKIKPLSWFALLIGPDIGYLLSVSTEESIMAVNNPHLLDNNYIQIYSSTSDYKKIDLSIIGELEFSRNHSGFKISFAQGLIDMVKNQKNIPGSLISLRPTTFKVGYIIGF